MFNNKVGDKMKRQHNLNVMDLVLKPRTFFVTLYSNNNYRKHALFLTLVSVLFVVLWFIRIFYLIFSPNHFNDEIALYAELFKVLDIRTVGIFLLFLVVDTLVIFAFTSVFALVANVVSHLLKLRLPYKYYWKISCYLTTLIIPLLLIQLLLDVTMLSDFYAIAATIVSVYGIVLFILGVNVFSKLGSKGG